MRKYAAFKGLVLIVASALIFAVPTVLFGHTLKQVVQYTVVTNPEVLATTRQKRASAETVNQARAGFFPSLDVRARVGREKFYNPNNASFIENNESQDPITASFNDYGAELRQNIFKGFETIYNVKRTRAKTDADSYIVCATAEAQALAATGAYLDVLRNRELVNEAKINLDNHLKIQSRVQDRGNSGIGRMADVYQVNARVALAKSDLLDSENELKNAEAVYSRITGLIPRVLESVPVPTGRFLPRNLCEAESMTLNYNPRLRAAIVTVAEAQALHNATLSTNYPAVDVVAEAIDSHNLSGVFGPAYNYGVYGEARWNIFRGGADVARQRETAYLAQQAAEFRNRTTREVIENMRLSWNAMETSRSKLTSLKNHAESSRLTTVAYTDQFKIGQRTLFDLLDSQNELYQARADYITGQYQVIFSKYRVVDAMGQVANFLNVKLPNEAHEKFNTYTKITEISKARRTSPEPVVILSDTERRRLIGNTRYHRRVHQTVQAESTTKTPLPFTHG